jgi:hypothetical protein
MVWRSWFMQGERPVRTLAAGASCLSSLTSRFSREVSSARRHQDQPVGLERLFDEVVGAALDRRDRGLDVAVAGDHHDRQIGMVLLDLLEQLQAVELGCPAARCRGTPDAAGGWRSRQRRIAVARGPGGEALVLQNARNQIANIGFVVDNQNVTCHGSRPVLSVACCGFDFWLVHWSRCRLFWFSGLDCFVSPAGGFGRFGFGALRRLAETAKRSRIQAPRCPGRNVGGILEFDAAAMVFQNAADDREPKAGALLARRHIGLEQPAAAHLRQADAVVDHVDHDVVALARGDDLDAALAEFSGGTARSPRSRS